MRILTGFLAFVFVVALASPSLAAWPHSPLSNVPVCNVTGAQQGPTIQSDGDGGAIIVWQDFRGGASSDIYAMHVRASGDVDPFWPPGGSAVCTATNVQQTPVMTTDGDVGAIIAWQDGRSANWDIYVQNLRSSGNVNASWPVNGRALVTLASDQEFPQICSDGAAGAIVTWRDSRGAATDIYAQHVLNSGAVDPAWIVDGRGICTATNHQQSPQIIADGAGGAIITWQDLRGGATHDIYAHHVLANGNMDAAWPSNGRAVCAAASTQLTPQLVSDGAGGAIIAWQDNRAGNFDIYAQHVLASGIVDPAWPVDGRALCTAVNSQINVQLAADGAGGAFLTWEDPRGAANDIYAHHVLASGVADPAWPADGRAVCTATGDQLLPRIAYEGSNAVIITWFDARSGAGDDVYAQRVLATGTVDPLWTANGVALSTMASDQELPQLVVDGNGGAIVAWQDARTSVMDIYAQRVGRHGFIGTPEAELSSVHDVPNDQGGQVKVSWNASYLEGEPSNLVTSYKVFRSVPPNLAARARIVDAADADLESMDAPGVIVRTVDVGETYFWEFLATVNVDFLPNYSYVAPTLNDSTEFDISLTAFMIQARTASSHHWESRPVNGRSVDNLAPLAPAPFTGQFGAGTTYLHWDPNTEADLAGYRLYRGSSAAFVPGPGNLVTAQPDTGYADAAGTPSFYKLTAIDTHGNESPVALLQPSGTLAVRDRPVATLSFARPAPNPSVIETAFRFALPRASHVRLAVYDATGRLVRELVRGPREAGEHIGRWDLRDDGGRVAHAGVYVARLEVDGKTLTRKVAVTN